MFRIIVPAFPKFCNSAWGVGSPPQSSRVSVGVREIHIGVSRALASSHWLVAKLGTVRWNVYEGPS